MDWSAAVTLLAVSAGSPLMGDPLLSLSLSPEIGQYLASAHAEAFVTINLDGSVGVMFDNELNSTTQSPAISLDQLAAEYQRARDAAAWRAI